MVPPAPDLGPSRPHLSHSHSPFTLVCLSNSLPLPSHAGASSLQLKPTAVLDPSHYIHFMSGSEGKDDPDKLPSRKDRPSLPSIRSLFGISRDDDLDTLLQQDSPGGRSTSPYDGRRPSRTPPGEHRKAPHAHLPLHRPSSSRPPPSAFPPGDLSLAGPSGTHSRRRSSGSSLDHAGPSRASAHQPHSDASGSPHSPPETPISAASPRDSRYGAGRGYSPQQGLASAGSSYMPEHPERPTSRGWHGSDRTIEPARPLSPSFTESSQSPTASTLVHRRPSTHSRPASPYGRGLSHSDRGSRRHTIGDDVREPRVEPSPSTSSSRPHTASTRRTLHPPYSNMPSPWGSTPDRHLPSSAGQSQLESQRNASRPSTSSHHPSLSLSSPAVAVRPATSPSPYQQPPPSSFPRRMSSATTTTASAHVHRGQPTPPPFSASVSALLPPPSAFEGPQHRRPYTADSSASYPSPEDDRPPSSPFVAVDPSRPTTSSGSTPSGAKYECHYCQKRFNRPSSLKIHVNTHTGEKPFQCPFPGCGRRFSVMSNMRRHSRVHSQPRLNEPESPVDGDADAEGELEAEPEAHGMEYMERQRPPLATLTGSSSSGGGPSTSTLRGSSSTSRRSSQRRASSRTALSSTHSPGAQVSAASGSGSGSGSGHRLIQPAPPRPLPMPLLVPVTPQSLSASAHRLLEESVGRSPARVTRASAAKRPHPDDDDLPGTERPSHKRTRSNDEDPPPSSPS